MTSTSLDVDNQENECEESTEDTNANVANGYEVVFPTERVSGAHDEEFLAVVWLDIELVVNLNLVVSFLDICHVSP